MMAEERVNPFAGLDKALLRSTRPQPVPQVTPQSTETPTAKPIAKPRQTTAKGSRQQPRHHDTTVPSDGPEQQPDQAANVESVRRAVKQLGKEAATYRFTADEKRALADIVYQYRGAGIRTSENEITRIAINSLVEDYRQHGDQSFLALVLQRLNA